jgi:uncharacterized tellurite resistance protein B-like protein
VTDDPHIFPDRLVSTLSSSAGKVRDDRAPRAREAETSSFADILPSYEIWRTAVLSVINLIEYFEEESIDIRDFLARLKHLYDLPE